MYAAVPPTTSRAMSKGFYRSIFVIYVRHKISCLLYKCVYVFLLFMERVHRTYSIGQKRTTPTDPNPNRAAVPTFVFRPRHRYRPTVNWLNILFLRKRSTLIKRFSRRRLLYVHLNASM